MPIARLSRRQFDVFFYLVKYFDAPLNQLINGFVHPKTISAVITALVSMGVYPIPMHQGSELDTERDIVKISL
jgi:hypothetical protein